MVHDGVELRLQCKAKLQRSMGYSKNYRPLSDIDHITAWDPNLGNYAYEGSTTQKPPAAI